ncbi:MAG: 50S ribosomal protein L15 [Opitutales bacterium]
MAAVTGKDNAPYFPFYIMELHTLQNLNFKKQARKRRGIGEGSGNGKTSGRGQKGQTSRTGSGIRHGFESGHIPLYRKLPQRGFNNANFRTGYQVVNLKDLVNVEAAEIDRDVLVRERLVRKNGDGVKLLGEGEISRAISITVDKASASARDKIEAAGGKVIIAEPASPAESEKKSEPASDEGSTGEGSEA